jgi:hypothetical protein
MQEVPPTEPIDEGDEGEWDTVGVTSLKFAEER